jgi:hypothetical protein
MFSKLLVAASLSFSPPTIDKPFPEALFGFDKVQGVACFNVPDVARFFQFYDASPWGTDLHSILTRAADAGVRCTAGTAVVGRLEWVPNSTFFDVKDGTWYHIRHTVYFPQGNPEQVTDLYLMYPTVGP